MGESCCGADRAAIVGLSPTIDRKRLSPLTGARRSLEVNAVDLVELPGGVFLMGSEDVDVNPDDGEGPVREVEVSPFAIGRTTVTNAQFATFADATGYVSGAERFGWSFVFARFLPAHLRRGAQRPASTPWWCRVDGATWKHPEGPDSSIDDRWDHPVVHIDHDDALAYCDWADLRLPTEAEWEYAARGGLTGARYPWGNDLLLNGEHQCNIWQGHFPTKNTLDDGYVGTAPAKTFEPNGYGLYNLAGNVWEWCDDWWGVDHAPTGCVNPPGPAHGNARVMRGGSYLCHHSYCNRYRVAARTRNAPDSASGNLSFRCARDMPPTYAGRDCRQPCATDLENS